MYELKIRDYCFIAHSLKDDFFGPAKHLHGTTYIIDMMLLSDKLINNNIIIDIGLATDILKTVIEKYNYKNLDNTKLDANFNKNALNQLLPYTENFYFQNIILDKKGKHVFPTIHNGDVRVKYISLDNSKGINIFSFLDFLREKKYDKWFTIHQPLLKDQTVEIAIENASKLFLKYKF